MKLCPKCALRYGDDVERCLVDGVVLESQPDPYLGRTLAGRYLIESKIGEGGMASVYRARHVLVDRLMAVKILGPHVASNPSVKERFRREAKNAAALSHPNIIEIYDHGETEDGSPFLVMEMLVGHSLADRVAEGPIPAAESAAIAWQVAQGLARAHDFGVIHRDLKPDNVFVVTTFTRPVVKLLDFGIARSTGDARLTNAGELFGTPQYMAPERLTSIDAGASSDLYALGVMLYEMVTGQVPFDGDSLPALFLAHLEKVPEPPSRHVRGLPAPLERLILGLLEKRPEDRPLDAHAVLRELAPWAPSEIHRAAPTQKRATVAHTLPPTTLEKWSRRTQIFDEMLRRAHPLGAPLDLRRRLDLVRSGISKMEALRAESLGFQRRLDVLAVEARETRERLGYAMHRLGEGLSHARAAQRQFEQEAALALEPLERAARDFRGAAADFEALGAPTTWAEPSEGVEAAIESLFAQHRAWLDVAGSLSGLREEREARTAEVHDLEFQVQAVRVQHSLVEERAETQRHQLETEVASRTERIDVMQRELLEHGTAIVDAVRATNGLADLFRRLEAEGGGAT